MAEHINTWGQVPTHTDAIADTGDGYTLERTRVEDADGKLVPGWAVSCLWCYWRDRTRGKREARARYADHETKALAVEFWNDHHPIGTPVTFWAAARAGAGVQSQTRSGAWLLGLHTPVVMVEGYAGGIALTHVECRSAECPVTHDVKEAARV